MKKSNWILGAMVLIVVLFGVLYLMPVREGGNVMCPNSTDTSKCNQKLYQENCIVCKSAKAKSVQPVNSANIVSKVKPVTR